ncbi:MAG: 3-keto-5-aminohexanoate cleavage protein [Promethearchaeota archaeon]|nr:MAG: 3-keto-5-aminohexanoate cleavage protein [Candidatus Lokiarchaeota archaeon]
MDISQKLIITATNANSWIYPDVKNWPDPNNVEALVDDVYKSYQAGASIAHVHPPLGKEKELVKRIREKCDIIIQIGMSSYPIEDRTETFNAKPDMMSIILNHHDEHFTQVHVNQLHSLEELEQYTIKCKDFQIKPEWEVWHMGSYWNLQYLIDKDLISPPHVLTLFFNWPGGTWSPPTPDEYLHRLKYIPKNCLHTVSVMGSEQIKIVPLAISHGGNVRVGTEDYPFINTEIPAKNTAELVSMTVKMAKQMGREVTSPIEARKILGMNK